MIIQNGHIQLLRAEGGGVDPATKHPIVAKETPVGPKIPCQWQAVRLDLLAKPLGEPAVNASYSILIENYNRLSGERLALYGRDGREVGKFSIIRIEPLDAVCQVRITV